MKKIVLIVLGLIVGSVVGLLGYVRFALPNVGPAPVMTIESTPERVERGKYLANHVTVCIDCHSTRDWSKFSGPLVPGAIGKGGELFDQKFGFPGAYYSRNITPAGIKNWTDGELFRLITTGVTKDGKAIFPVMPYPYYGRMDEEDIKSIIAYVRTLPALENEVPASRSDFPMNFIVNTIPHKASLVKRPDPKDEVKTGEYLANAGACMECHTQVEKGQVIPSLAYAGGREFPMPTGDMVRSANITPDVETGIGKMTRKEFVARFKERMAAARAPAQGFNTIMPWGMYGGMTDQDLGAIYEYLRTISPKANNVVKYTPAK
ncbi:MAG: cytochrome c [Leptospirales bacterium]|nr:cytochrome c [Leptospirales bacterium]